MAYADEEGFVDDHGRVLIYEPFEGLIGEDGRTVIVLNSRQSLKVLKIWLEEQLKGLSEVNDGT